ncbi:MAG: serine hydrolase [Bacteroidota bacterium]
MKRKILIAIVVLLSSLVTIGYLINPQIFKIAWFQKPDVKTYENFPIREMQKSPNPFVFPENLVVKTSLDPVLVKNWKGEMVSFSDYFKTGKLLAFLVIKNDTLVYEKYGHGYGRTTLSNTFSIGKSMISIATGKALELGYLEHTEQNVTDFLSEFKENPDFNNVRIEDLLNMKSGLKFKRAGDGIFSDLFCDEAKFYYTRNLKKDLLKVKFDTLPGQRWKYSNLDPLILTWIIEKASGQFVSDFFEQHIWHPIGAEYKGSWGIDHMEGLENSPSSFQCTAIDLAKIGRLLLNDGVRDSTQILSTDWIKKSVGIQQKNRANTSKGTQRATHQYYWWLPQEGFEGDFSAEGLRGQRLYINPIENIIIVQFANGGYGGYPYRTIAKHFAENPN